MDLAKEIPLIVFYFHFCFWFSSLVLKINTDEHLSLSSVCSITDNLQIKEVSKTERCKQGTMAQTNLCSHDTLSINRRIEFQTPCPMAESLGNNNRPNSEALVPKGNAFGMGFISGRSLLCVPSISEIYELSRKITERQDIFLPNI